MKIAFAKMRAMRLPSGSLMLFAFWALSAGSLHSSNLPVQTVPAGWKAYINARFGYAVCYPPELLKPQGESDNGDGQAFLSPDGQIKMLAYGSNQIDEGETLAHDYQSILKEEAEKGTKPAYSVLKNDFFVVSWQDGDHLHYERTAFYDGAFKTFSFDYPIARTKEMDEVIGKVTKCFQPHLKVSY